VKTSSHFLYRILYPVLGSVFFLGVLLPIRAVSANQVSGSGLVNFFILSRPVGEVSDRVVSSREVRINHAIGQVMGSSEPGVAEGQGRQVLTGLESSFSNEVSRVLDEWIIYFEAKSLSSQPIAKNELVSEVKKVQDVWGAKSSWQDLEVTPDEVREVVERKMMVRSFEKLKRDPGVGMISDDEALAYYRKNRNRFGSAPFAAYKEVIKAFLVKTQNEKRLAEWLDVLRRKYKVRNLVSG
jgi:hypothetical protein